MNLVLFHACKNLLAKISPFYDTFYLRKCQMPSLVIQSKLLCCPSYHEPDLDTGLQED